MTPFDPQMVEQGDVIRRVRVPAVLRGDGGARLAAGVALITGRLQTSIVDCSPACANVRMGNPWPSSS
jgi:hypothetical protein